MTCKGCEERAKTIERMTAVLVLVLDAVCPCCEELRKCVDDCTFAADDPIEHDRMMDARSVLYGD